MYGNRISDEPKALANDVRHDYTRTIKVVRQRSWYR